MQRKENFKLNMLIFKIYNTLRLKIDHNDFFFQSNENHLHPLSARCERYIFSSVTVIPTNGCSS